MIRTAGAFAIAASLLAIAMWTVVPGPNLLALGFSIFASELAPQCFAGTLIVGAGCVWLARGRSRAIVAVIVLLGLIAFAQPLLAVPGTWSRADAALRAQAIGPARPHPPLAVTVTHDLRVPLRDGTALALDLYRPDIPGVLPLIVTIYGGAWNSGSKAFEAPLAREYASRGFAVATIEYRLAPHYRFPVELNDVDDALKAIAVHAAEWHVDGGHVALFGRSAGAELALLAGEQEQPLHVRAVIAYYAPTNLIGGWETPPQPDPAGVRAILEGYLDGPPGPTRDAAYRVASPLDQAHAGMPAVLAIIGDRDELVLPKFQRAFAARLDALHVPNVAIELPWANHAFDALDGLGATLAKDATTRYLDTFLR